MERGFVFSTVFLMIILSYCMGDVNEISYAYPVPQPPFFDERPSSTPPSAYLPPPLHDEIPQQIYPTYLPPSVVYPPVGAPPEDEILPPFDDTVIVPSPPPPNHYLPPPPYPVAGRTAPFQVFNMSCLEARHHGNAFGHFRTLLRHTGDARTQPIVENYSLGGGGGAQSGDCAIGRLSADTFAIAVEGRNMAICGVRNCGDRLCMTLRMATVPGLRLPDDLLVTLQCLPQEAVVTHTKHLRLNAHAHQGRAATKNVAIASGGNQRHFEVQANLLRKRSGSDVFDQPVQQGSAVRLGDELLLRTIVREGDGWRSSKMGSVTIRSTANQKSVVLVDEDGCRKPQMKSICPFPPQQINPLIIQLPFRAFLFQGASPADDLLLSVRMSACLLPQDCYQTKVCDDNKNRVRRSAGNSTQTGKMIKDLETQFHFRVLPPNSPNTLEIESFDTTPVIWLVILIAVIAAIGALVVILLGKSFSKLTETSVSIES